jgi:hypothetical protein
MILTAAAPVAMGETAVDGVRETVMISGHPA